MRNDPIERFLIQEFEARAKYHNRMANLCLIGIALTIIIGTIAFIYA